MGYFDDSLARHSSPSPAPVSVPGERACDDQSCVRRETEKMFTAPAQFPHMRLIFWIKFTAAVFTGEEKLAGFKLFHSTAAASFEYFCIHKK